VAAERRFATHAVEPVNPTRSTAADPTDPASVPISHHVWDTKYRYREGDGPRDATLEDTWRRVSRALAAAEPRDREQWAERFFAALADFRFVPGGRILAGAGTERRVTLFNCFVMGEIEDSLDGIFDALKEGALTMQQGGGVGYDFSTLRPRGTHAHSVGGIASGPVSFMRIWDSMCATLLSTGARRGAMMATLRCDHPDVEAFVGAKREPGELTNFNLSLLVTDAFMSAVARDEEWPLVFPAARLDGAEGPLLEREWSGAGGPLACRVLRVVRARELWRRIMRACYEYAEPGVLFIDRINELNNLRYRERISATNPCGEIPLPPYGACNLGSLNLTRFVREPFTPQAFVDTESLAGTAEAAVRMLDDVIDVSRFPLRAHERQARGTRRVGLGITGLADALAMLGFEYASEAARAEAASLMRLIRDSAYRASIALAREKAPFPFFERDAYLAAPFVAALPAALREAIAREGIRNSHLLAIAPTGTISVLAGNVSSGIEPIFDARYRRQVLNADGTRTAYEVEDYACRAYRARTDGERLPPAFVAAAAVPAEKHLAMQAALQPYVDNAISKTVNVSREAGFEAFKSLYEQAYALGLKGCTAFRANPITGEVLSAGAEAVAGPGPHCCSLEREAD